MPDVPELATDEYVREGLAQKIAEFTSGIKGAIATQDDRDFASIIMLSIDEQLKGD